MMNKKTRLLSEILMLAMKVDEETEYCVFVNVSGHVKTIEIHITPSRKNYQKHLADCEFHYNVDSLERMEVVKERLISFLKSGVDTSDLDYWVEEVKHYTF